TVDNAQADNVSRTRWENATRDESSSKKIGHPADRLVRRCQERAGDSETSVASWLSEPNENLVEHAIEAPVPAVKFAGVEISEVTVVVPKAGLVIAEQASIARQAVGLISNLRNCEQRSIHRKIHAVIIVRADGWIAVVNATHDVGPRGWSYF